MIILIMTLIEHTMIVLNSSPFVFKTIVISDMQTES